MTFLCVSADQNDDRSTRCPKGCLDLYPSSKFKVGRLMSALPCSNLKNMLPSLNRATSSPPRCNPAYLIKTKRHHDYAISRREILSGKFTLIYLPLLEVLGKVLVLSAGTSKRVHRPFM